MLAKRYHALSLLTCALLTRYIFAYLLYYILTHDEDMLEVVGLEPHVDGLAREATVSSLAVGSNYKVSK